MHTLPHLPYEYDALEPIIDTQTMQIHHTRHHQTYIDKLNIWLSVYPEYEWLSAKDLLLQFDILPETLKPIVRNHAWWHANHSLFWKIMCPLEESKEWKIKSEQLMKVIDETFGSFDNFVEQFISVATNQFGSGRTRLVKEWINLRIVSTANQDSPWMQWLVPLLGIDVREHAYYLKYQNRRIDYIKSWFDIINWNEVQQQLIIKQ